MPFRTSRTMNTANCRIECVCSAADYMDFELSEDHLAFRDMVRKWVDKEAPKAWARELERDEHNYPFALWDKFTEAGFHGVGIAEQFGGPGGDVVMQMILG